MFWRRDVSQATVDRREEEAVTRYRERQPLGMYRQLRTAVEEARRLADARGRLEVALERRRLVDVVTGERR